MELLLNTQEERCRVAVYNEYLKKLPQLLTQLETVETMYEKALMELEMLRDKDPADQSVILYRERLEKTRQQLGEFFEIFIINCHAAAFFLCVEQKLHNQYRS